MIVIVNNNAHNNNTNNNIYNQIYIYIYIYISSCSRAPASGAGGRCRSGASISLLVSLLVTVIHMIATTISIIIIINTLSTTTTTTTTTNHTTKVCALHGCRLRWCSQSESGIEIGDKYCTILYSTIIYYILYTTKYKLCTIYCILQSIYYSS